MFIDWVATFRQQVNWMLNKEKEYLRIERRELNRLWPKPAVFLWPGSYTFRHARYPSVFRTRSVSSIPVKIPASDWLRLLRHHHKKKKKKKKKHQWDYLIIRSAVPHSTIKSKVFNKHRITIIVYQCCLADGIAKLDRRVSYRIL